VRGRSATDGALHHPPESLPGSSTMPLTDLSGLSFVFDRKDASPQKPENSEKRTSLVRSQGDPSDDGRAKEIAIETWLGRAATVAVGVNYALALASLLIRDWRPEGLSYVGDFFNAILAHVTCITSRERCLILKGEESSVSRMITSTRLPSKFYGRLALCFVSMGLVELGQVAYGLFKGDFEQGLGTFGSFLVSMVVAVDTWQFKKVSEKKERGGG